MIAFTNLINTRIIWRAGNDKLPRCCTWRAANAVCAETRMQEVLAGLGVRCGSSWAVTTLLQWKCLIPIFWGVDFFSTGKKLKHISWMALFWTDERSPMGSLSLQSGEFRSEAFQCRHLLHLFCSVCETFSSAHRARSCSFPSLSPAPMHSWSWSSTWSHWDVL